MGAHLAEERHTSAQAAAVAGQAQCMHRVIQRAPCEAAGRGEVVQQLLLLLGRMKVKHEA